MHTDKKLSKLWDDLGNISVNDNDCIEQDFLHFKKGTNKLDIWHWFDENHSIGVHALMYKT
ncbi:hypothetical protein LCGC14_2469700 [marine sediment metagenome]|uniref:Uncharacterized protein n=1 Tax=marine sediment metagenome TaxID=412755 RepID=A0A0F9BAN3_9ZZZZ